MKLAAIDIGSNSVHLVVAHIDGDGNFDIVATHKEMVRLGARSLANGFLADDAQERGLGALQTFRRIADGYGVSDVIAYATSATREARNGQQFIDRVREVTGIDARIISGIEEGRLIYLGVREVFDFGARKALIIDIGGGSVEIILADRLRDHLVRSLKLGVRRLHDEFPLSDPPTQAELAALEAHVREQVAPVVAEAKQRGFDVVLASSGTARVLARITAARSAEAKTPGKPLNTRITTARNLNKTVRILSKATREERALIPGMDDKRREAILEGAVLMNTLLDAFDAPSYEFCDAALREGMIVDYLERNRPGLRMIDNIVDPRRRSVMTLAKRMYPSMSHVEQVARIAVRLFDQLQPLHGYGPAEREMLEFAAILHNVGRTVSASAHHKHSLYIVRHADLTGFSPEDQLMLANISRYHRRSVPKPRHPEWMELDAERKQQVVDLSILLRLASALDRGHQSNVTGLNASVEDDVVRIQLTTRVPADVEILATERRAHHILREYGRRLEVVETPGQPSLMEAL